MMVSDDCTAECKIESSDEEQMNTPPPPPEFASKASTPAPRTPPPPARISRDPHGINRHLKVEVGDVLAEAAGLRSVDAVWTSSLAVFEWTRVWTYRCLSLLLAIPLAVLCGVLLAALACLRVWLLVPCLQLSSTFLPCLRSVFLCTIHVFVSPFCTFLVLCCSHVSIALSNRGLDAKRHQHAV